MTNPIVEHPWVTTVVIAWVALLAWAFFRNNKPPEDPPPSGFADSDFGLGSSLGLGGSTP